MDQLIKGKKKLGGYYVRPVSWAGIWEGTNMGETGDSLLVSGNTLFESDSEEECNIYIEEYPDKGNTLDFNGIQDCLSDNEELKKLIAENPNLPIMYMCGEECYCDDFGYTINTGSYQVEEVTLIDDMICADRADLEERIYYKLNRKYPKASKKLLDMITKEKLEKYIWKKVITVRLG